MKLLEILVRDVKTWPESTTAYAQDRIRENKGYSFPWKVAPTYLVDGLWNNHPAGVELPGEIDFNLNAEVIESEIAEDQETAVVTREMWLAEKEKQNV